MHSFPGTVKDCTLSCVASFGKGVARSLKPARTRLPVQYNIRNFQRLWLPQPPATHDREHIAITHTAACQHIGRPQGSVFSRIPLCGKRRIHRGKIVIANPQDTFGAVRAFCTARTDANLTLPCVSIFASPSHLLMAAR